MAGRAAFCVVALGASALAVGWPVSARAGTNGGAPAPSTSSAETRAETGSADVVHIVVGRALDLEGRAVYADRSSFSGSAGVTRFSTTPVYRPRPAGHIALSSAMPLQRGALTSGFGLRRHPLLGGIRMHSGVDLAAPIGSPVLATSDGVVGQAGWRGGYGLFVALNHAGGLQTRYGHMSQIAVRPGQGVQRGDVIGYVGSTGRSTGPHLHYETRLNGVAVNPRFDGARRP